MHTANISVEFISPCFNGGGQPGESELRTLSVRGQLRWWYRICGAKPCDEADLFGSSAPKKGQSKIKIRIDSIRPSGKPFNPKEKSHGKLTRYLWFYMGHQGRIPINAGTTFDLIFRSKDAEKLKSGVAVALAWITFGSLGSRATRAAGCMRLLGGESGTKDLSDLIESVSQAKRPREVWDQLTGFLPKAGANSDPSRPFELYFQDDQTRFNDDWLKAACWIADSWHALRNYQTDDGIGQKDHDDAIAAKRTKDFRDRKDLSVRRAAFGLPYQQLSRKPRSPFSGRGGLRWKVAKGQPFADSERMASPVHLRLMAVDGRIVPAVLIFPKKASQCPNKLFAPGAGMLPVDADAALTAARAICNTREI